jgi:glycosyltransferase involved in cell wall biosynthesis
MKQARLLIFPSEWNEGFGVTLVEAMACGLPIVASALGSAAEIVQDGRTGRHFKPGDHESLADAVADLWSRPGEICAMKKEARREYELKYTAELNYNRLLEIYAAARRNAHRAK